MVGNIFQITYPNGFTQKKICIDHNEYLRVKNIEDEKEYYKQYKQLANMEWFTSESSFSYAYLNNGSFKCYSGEIIIKIEKI